MSINLKALITIVFCIGTIILFLIVGEYNFYSYLNEHWDKAVALASAIGTVIAAIATWRAARRAADGAEIARQSMEAAGQAAKETLQETQLYNRRTSFENRYALLLAQHDQYHKQLCDYIDHKEIGTHPHSRNSLNISVLNFFKEAGKSQDCNAVLSFLTGHEIISRYMRTLYHLMRFVHEDFYLDSSDDCATKKRRYTSPVRSIIRNDVLFMIALNALNVKSSISKVSGYPHYQMLLHFFNFFEHAIFIKPLAPNEIFINTDWEKLIHYQINSQLENEECGMYGENIFSLPKIIIFSPVIACLLVYENPMKKATTDALETYYRKSRSDKNEYEIKNVINNYEKNKNLESAIKNGSFKRPGSEVWEPVTEDDIEIIRGEIAFGIHSFEHCIFKLSSVPESWNGTDEMRGEHVYGIEKDILFHDKIYNEIMVCGGLSSYLNYLQSNYEKNLLNFYSDIAFYDVRQSPSTIESICDENHQS